MNVRKTTVSTYGGYLGGFELVGYVDTPFVVSSEVLMPSLV